MEEDETTLDQQVAIVTGASSGIGRAIAVAFGRHHMWVALAARREQELEEVANEVESAGGRSLVVPTDVTSSDQVNALVEKTLAQWGNIDVVVTNAGQYIHAVTTEVTMEEIEHSVEVNLYGQVRVVLAALPHMIAQGRGHVVLMASVDGKKALPTDLPYAIAKFGLVGFGDVARQELRPHGVTVTTVLPGRVKTAFVSDLKLPWISSPIPPERVAQAVIRAMRRNKAEIVIPGFNKALVWLHTLSPRMADRAVKVLGLKGTKRTAGD